MPEYQGRMDVELPLPGSFDRATVRALAQRSDARGLLQFSLHLICLLATGAGVWASRGHPWLVGALVIHGIVLCFLFCALHESIHRTAFATRALSDTVAWICGALLMLPPEYFRQFHFAHHRFTQDRARDPELAAPPPATLGEYLWRLSGVPYWRDRLTVTLRHAFTGRVSEPFIPAAAAPLVVREARELWVFYLSIIALSIYLGRADALIYWVIPAILGQPFLRLFLLAEHTGCAFGDDMLTNTRTTYTSRALLLLAWRMPYHGEHHYLPSVPFHALARVNRLIGGRTRVTARGYVAVHRELVRGLRAARTLQLLLTAATVLWVPLWAHGQLAAAAALPSLPEGAGREIAAASCLRCHDAARLATPGYTEAGWRDAIGRMIKVGATLAPQDIPRLTSYLARAFPPQPQPAARLIAGDVQVSFREWAVATTGAFPHDPLATADGALWYTGQRASLLGRIDPHTGAIREYPTAIPDSGPHGLTADAEGNIWFTANSAGYIGKLDPKSGAIRVYRMPDPRARDPHTLIFDRRGVLWFTVQGANMVGRLVPRNGEIKLVTVPTPHALPYGMVISSKDVPYFAEFGTSRIGEIDPGSMKIREHVLPNSAARPRRIALGPDDVIWYSDYARGYLGRLDPASGAAREWPSPGGPQSQPYGITLRDGIVWYCESGVRPNTLVRFDPGSAKFQSWAIPSGGGVVRNMMVTPGGQLVLAESGVGKIALVTIR